MRKHRSSTLGLLPFLFCFVHLANAQAPKEYTVSPLDGAIGQEVAIVVASDDTCTTEKHFEDMTIAQAAGITVKEQKLQSDCLMTAILSISDKARPGDRKLPVVRKEGNADKGMVGFVRFEVTGLKPQVDLMWKILPKGPVGDNFGNRIAKRYYAVEVIIGNNSGYDLQLAGVGFSMPACQLAEGTTALKPNFDCADITKKALRKIPTDSYQIVRGSLEREDEYGKRHFALGTLKTIGLLMTGLLPFFPNPSSDAGTVANFVNNPVTQGFELLFPRTTIRQLQRLEIQTLHDGLIVPHNAHRRALSFIAKKVVGLGKADRDDPQKVMARLGEMVIVGRQVQYLQRVQVTSQGDGSVSPPVVTKAELGDISQAETNVARRVSGRNLREVDITPTQEGSGLTVSDIVGAQGGHFVDFKVSAERDARLGARTLLLSNSYGGFPLDINVVAATPKPTPQELPIAAADNDGTLTISGEFLKDIKEVFAIVDDQGEKLEGLTFELVGTSTDSSSEWKVTVKDTLDRATEKPAYKLRLKYSEPPLTKKDTGLTVKVEKKADAGGDEN